MVFSPFEGGRGDETFPRHPESFIPLTPFKGGKCFVSLCHGVNGCRPHPEKGFEIASIVLPPWYGEIIPIALPGGSPGSRQQDAHSTWQRTIGYG